ncbi:amino acid ABC transporter permease [Bordetella bronchiseptica]|uniref:amino acid ABC transporter permease n=1 Tax=Bordetella bronchiseptica TaxID=518 RepID=UPI0004620530|nr:amino acid ABC transporter permease [Bordetella bronchiseptica]KDC75150.1 ABC transporter, permease protein [Bordetella bronchiseptica MBORD632]KDD03518.1 ABC transporter, permease protein [Bordetella bronchiseptica MBORD698]KDD04801.1 ABC transporter, permease protein [Bordetella bronchiseptica MBORD681]
MGYQWNWGVLFALSPDGGQTYLQTLLDGLAVTVQTAALAWALALGLGIAVGVARTLPYPFVKRLAAVYVEVFRNIPLIVQMFLWYFVLPELLPKALGDWIKQLPEGSFYTAALSIGVYMSARIGEQLRAGIEALPPGQRQAGLALGLTLPQLYRHVLLPNALRMVLPTMTSDCLNTIKNTSVALTIGLADLTAQAHAMQEYSFQVFEAFLTATVAYLALNLIVIVAMRALERWVSIPGQSPRRAQAAKGGRA